jgi:hypothetical protein
MRALFLAALLLTGCTTFTDSHVPVKERKPLLTPDAKKLRAAMKVGEAGAVEHFQAGFHFPLRDGMLPIDARSSFHFSAGAAKRVYIVGRAEKTMTVKLRVNGELLLTKECAPGECRLEQVLPPKVVFPEWPAHIDLESSEPWLLAEAGFRD